MKSVKTHKCIISSLTPHAFDKSNVRFVIHADLPKNIEGYYQETGRAGRDGEPADCILFFGRGDISKIRYFIDQIADEGERSIALAKLRQTVKYASHNVCRRRQLLEYFGERYGDENCETCDICTGTVEMVDITIDAQIVMSAMSRTDQRFGAGHVIDIVTGADTKRIRGFQHDKIKTYGAGKHKDKKHWYFIVDELLAQEVIIQDGDRYPVLKITEKGRGILFGKEKISALKREETKKKRHAKAGNEFEPFDEVLFKRLRTLRKKLADEQQVPPYIVFSDRTLHEMCRYYPLVLPDMAKMTGVGDAKLERYGADFTEMIRAYLDENPGITVPVESLSFDLEPLDRQVERPEETPSFVAPAKPVAKKARGKTIEKTYELFVKGLSIGQISGARNLAESTVTGHMEQLIMGGREIEMGRLLDAEKLDKIGDLFLALQSWELNPVVEHFKGTISYDEAKLVRAYMQQKGS